MRRETKFTFKIAEETVTVQAVAERVDDEHIFLSVKTRQDALMLAYHYSTSGSFKVKITWLPSLGAWGLFVDNLFNNDGTLRHSTECKMALSGHKDPRCPRCIADK